MAFDLFGEESRWRCAVVGVGIFDETRRLSGGYLVMDYPKKPQLDGLQALSMGCRARRNAEQA
ncbi:MAG: hypothetical protein PVG22_06250 [Chromatiales bacterium]|jgi:hypothetical protein